MNVNQEQSKLNKGSIFCTMVITGTLTVVFGIYAFSDVDEEECWVRDSKSNGLMLVDREIDTKFHSNYYDVGREFHTFFVIGFLLFLI